MITRLGRTALYCYLPFFKWGGGGGIVAEGRIEKRRQKIVKD